MKEAAGFLPTASFVFRVVTLLPYFFFCLASFSSTTACAAANREIGTR
jgi:hypothetical protein